MLWFILRSEIKTHNLFRFVSTASVQGGRATARAAIRDECRPAGSWPCWEIFRSSFLLTEKGFEIHPLGPALYRIVVNSGRNHQIVIETLRDEFQVIAGSEFWDRRQ